MKARIAVAGIESCPILSISAIEKIVGSDSRFLAAFLSHLLDVKKLHCAFNYRKQIVVFPGDY